MTKQFLVELCYMILCFIPLCISKVAVEFKIPEVLIENNICFRLLDIRFPQASVTYAGCVKLLKSMKVAGVSSGHISIPENVLLRKDELEWLKGFAFDELPVRSAFRR